VGNSRLGKVCLSNYCFVHHVFVLILIVVPLGHWGKHKGASILYDSLSTNNWRTGMHLLKHCNYFDVASFVLFYLNHVSDLCTLLKTQRSRPHAYWIVTRGANGRPLGAPLIVTVATIVWSKLHDFNHNGQQTKRLSFAQWYSAAYSKYDKSQFREMELCFFLTRYLRKNRCISVCLL